MNKRKPSGPSSPAPLSAPSKKLRQTQLSFVLSSTSSATATPVNYLTGDTVAVPGNI